MALSSSGSRPATGELPSPSPPLTQYMNASISSSLALPCRLSNSKIRLSTSAPQAAQATSLAIRIFVLKTAHSPTNSIVGTHPQTPRAIEKRQPLGNPTRSPIATIIVTTDTIKAYGR
ncbi:hypothetical protein VC83_04599 [Pseudogymnoascus destructans]|uniref:Uncharacterized protein n=1 Tax=Pseudogymnoascus destructans TaxID=655981 RepID=A0A177A868_9PEZI|nr:uncharacterized protein VC83_04599 [Pseudogymnoascus destructans]OAF57461.1 hypothetical protein VC83_04599 [Pseudogymnoascus destructans]